MRYHNRLLAIMIFFCAGAAQASKEQPFYFFADVLYWQGSQAIDWAYDNSLTTPDQTISYQTSSFDAKPGYRLGIGYGDSWDVGIYYTQYNTDTHDSATGNLKSGFIGGTIGLPPGHPFYHSGQFKMDIDFDMFDAYVGRRFQITPTFMLHPTVGLEGGWINQTMRGDFQGFYDTSEKLHNDFWGVGPKFGIDGALALYQHDDYAINLIAGFATAYLFGSWDLTDVYEDNSPRTIDVDLDERHLGAVTVQGTAGMLLAYKAFSVGLSYEINDWFDQCQIFDDATGGHDNDLMFQGLTLRLKFQN